MKNHMAEASNETYCITRLKFRLFGVSERHHSENVPAKKCYTSIVARLLDVLTPLSDWRQESVEKMERWRISGVSYMCWMDFHNGILC